MSSLWLGRCLYIHLARISVSRYGKSKLRPQASDSFFIKPISKLALCATITQPLQNAIKSSICLSNGNASLTIDSVIDVSSVIFFGIDVLGFTKLDHLSIISPFKILTAPISIILHLFLSSPVVSISKTTNGESTVSSVISYTIFFVSSTR